MGRSTVTASRRQTNSPQRKETFLLNELITEQEEVVALEKDGSVCRSRGSVQAGGRRQLSRWMHFTVN